VGSREVDDVDLAHRQREVTVALNKKYGVLSRFTSDGSANVPLSGLPRDVWPIGRLDADSEGLLVLSEDKSLVAKMLSATKTYLAQVERVPADLSLLRSGVVIEGKKTLPAEAALVDEPEWLWPRDPPIRFRKSVPTAWVQLRIREGRNRQVRKMTAAIGHPTLRLIRVAIGGFWIAPPCRVVEEGDGGRDVAGVVRRVEPGAWVALNRDEVAALLR
jgi:23S rRNA pseudouridine2457 synthase